MRDSIRDGADRYYLRSLTHNEALCFERWFIDSRDFRKFVIPYLATAERRVHTSAYQYAEFNNAARWDDYAKAGLCQFRYERSRAKELASAERKWERAAARLGLPAVDLRTGALLPDREERWLAAA